MICGMTYYQICWYFLIYSFGGWALEVVYHAVACGKVINRGFLNGPVCPVYGFGVLSVFAMMNTFQGSGYQLNDGMIFLFGVILATAVELIAGWLLDVCFHARWWDYSNRKFNINGRVCLNNAFFFGVLGTFLVYFANPFFEGLLLKINTNTLNIISLILLIIFTIDFIISTYASFKLKNSLSKIDKDSTEEIKEKIKEKIESKFLNRRIFKAYPKYKINIIKRLEEYRKEKIEKK